MTARGEDRSQVDPRLRSAGRDQILLGQFLEGWILTPWLQSTSLDLNAVTVLIAVLVGGTLGGLYGLILAVPVTACGKILLKELALPRLAAWADGQPD